MFGRAASCEIVRRGHGNLTQLRTEFDRDHILLDDLADADRGVVAAGHDVHDFIIQRDVEDDVRVLIVKRSQQRPQEQLRLWQVIVPMHPDR